MRVLGSGGSGGSAASAASAIAPLPRGAVGLPAFAQPRSLPQPAGAGLVDGRRVIRGHAELLAKLRELFLHPRPRRRVVGLAVDAAQLLRIALEVEQFPLV